MEFSDVSAKLFETTVKPELIREVTKLGFNDESTKMNDDAATLVTEYARVLIIEAALRAARHSSRAKTSRQVDAEDVEKALVHLLCCQMSLFRCRSSWSTSLDDGDDQCGHNCLLVSSELTTENKTELIVVCSYSGMLRIFRPTPGPNDAAQPSDLILEKQLSFPALEVASGVLRSGTTNHQLAVMSTQCVAVYNLVVALSNSDLAVSCKLESCFERPISENLGTCWQIVVGRFGGGNGSKSGLSSIGIVTSGGCLVIFEKEAREPLVVKLFSPDSAPLLGATVAYCSPKDSFLVVTPKWEMQMHKYSSLVKSSKDAVSRLPDWSVILTDPVTSLEVVNSPVDGPGILLMGQRSLTYWQWNGVVKFSRKLPYSPLCMHHLFTEEKLMVLVASETLLLYSDGMLCWASQLPSPTICMSTINFKGVVGNLVLLSDTLDLQICHLGTEPAMFGTPAPKDNVRANISVEEMTEELNRLNAKLKLVAAGAPVGQSDLKVSVAMVKRATRGAIRLNVVAPISLLSLSVMVSPPIEANPKSVSISSLCDSIEIPLTFTMKNDSAPPTCMDVDICASYAKADGTPQIIQCSVTQLPLSMLLYSAREESSEEKQSIEFQFAGNYNDTVRAYLPGMQSGGGTMHCSGPFGNMSVQCAPGNPSKCTLRSSSIALLSLVASSVLRTPGLLPTTQRSQQPVNWLLESLDELFEKRFELTSATEDLKAKTYWARQVQFGLLNKYRDQTALLLNGMDVLLHEGFSDILQHSNKIAKIKQDIEKRKRHFGCVLKLCCQLLIFSANPPKSDHMELIEAAFGHSFIHKNWVEQTTSSLEYVLQTMKGGPSGGHSFGRESQPARLKLMLKEVFSGIQ